MTKEDDLSQTDAFGVLTAGHFLFLTRLDGIALHCIGDLGNEMGNKMQLRKSWARQTGPFPAQVARHTMALACSVESWIDQ